VTRFAPGSALCGAGLAGLLVLGALSAAAPAAAVPAPVAVPPPVVGAPAYVLLDTASGQVLASENADARREPASLTKLMTAYLAFAALRDKAITATQIVPVSTAAWRAEGSRMFIEPRKSVTVDELLRGMIVQSGNDAAIALAEVVAGSEPAFAERMNGEAARLGLASTRFANATGLSDPQQYSTATDVARLAAAIVRDFPDQYPLYSIRDYRYNNITQPNRNRLLWIDPYVDGMKTGHTDAAGWCLVASAKRGDRRLIAVVLGGASDAMRTSDAQRLLNYGFQAFDTVQLYVSGQEVKRLRVWKGEEGEVAAGVFGNQFLTVPKGRADKLALSMTATEPLVAPVTKGQELGTVRISLDGKAIAEIPLVALGDVPVANAFRRAWDTIRLWLR
jgi:D-alanyl-D-alanine carboxypeptidase (penicillin-binding protein 5/6)